MFALPPHTAASAFPPADLPLPPSASRVRIAFFSDCLPERNGAGAYYYDLATHLRPHVEALEMFQPLARHRFSMPALPMPGDPSQKLITPNLVRIARGVRALRPNLVVAVTPGPFGLLGLHYAKRLGIPLITAFHTDFERLAKIYWNPLFRAVATGYLRGANRLLCRNSATVLINNFHLKSDVRALGADAVDVVGTPLSPPFLQRPLRPVPKRIEQVCFVGRLAPEKNVDLLIAAAARLPHLRVVIGGDGPLKSKLEKTAANCANVRFTGWLKREQLIELLDDSSLLVLPSSLESFGSVALEAMARARPALVSEVAGIHQWPDLQTGLFTLRPEETLAEAIERLLDIPADDFHARCLEARGAAERFNHSTIGHWIEVLDRYCTT